MVSGEMATQQRPLVLLHKCAECATFALTTTPIAQEMMHVERVRTRFTRLRLGSAPASLLTGDGCCSNGLETNIVFEENEDELDEDEKHGSQSSVFNADYDSGIGSNVVSCQSSPDDSPVSRSDSPSPNGLSPSSSNVPIDNDDLARSKQSPKSFRNRSVSDCESMLTSPLKGILKRRPVFRSFSECAEEQPDFGARNWATSENLTDVLAYGSGAESGESLDDDGDGNQGLGSNKKTVRFNDRVQENLFRPNLSIVGQNRRNQRKGGKRARTNSATSSGGDSQASCSETETDSRSTPDDQKNKHAPDQTRNNEQQQKEDNKTGMEAERKKAQQRRANRKNTAAVLEDKRYGGFVLGTPGGPGKVNHQRRPSGDSALGDDEEDAVVAVEQTTAPAVIRVGGDSPERKDSGIDDEL